MKLEKLEWQEDEEEHQQQLCKKDIISERSELVILRLNKKLSFSNKRLWTFRKCVKWRYLIKDDVAHEFVVNVIFSHQVSDQ